MTKGNHPIPRFFVLALALQLAACATPERFSAANDVHAFLVSVRDNDRAAFNAHVDRRALEAQMRQAMLQKVDQAQVGTSLKLLGALLAVPTSRAVGDEIIQPKVFRFAAEYYGYTPDTPIPGVLALSIYMQPLSPDRVCARHGKPPTCLLTFAREGDTWRLVALGQIGP